MAARKPARIKVGSEVELPGLDGVWTVSRTWVKEVQLVRGDRTIVRHSRTVARALEQQKAVTAA